MSQTEKKSVSKSQRGAPPVADGTLSALERRELRETVAALLCDLADSKNTFANIPDAIQEMVVDDANRYHAMGVPEFAESDASRAAMDNNDDTNGPLLRFVVEQLVALDARVNGTKNATIM